MRHSFFVFWGVSKDGSGGESDCESEGKERYDLPGIVVEWQENLPWLAGFTKFTAYPLLRCSLV